MKKQSIKTQKSLEAHRVWEILNNIQRERIQKNYPFRIERNVEIRRLKSKGVTVRVLVELTGISRSHILRITQGSKNMGVGLSVLKEEVVNIQTSARRMAQHLLAFQNMARKGGDGKGANNKKRAKGEAI